MAKNMDSIDDFAQELKKFNVIENDLTKNQFIFLGTVSSKDKFDGLYVFEKDKKYYYFKQHPDYHILDDTYELIKKTAHKAEKIRK
jgi:hypothetical protein